jgi:glycosyltransferase involved in cell wall biosynthesis
MDCAVVILTRNEQQNLPRCLASLQALPATVFVVDSGSTDQTREIAESYNAAVVEHPFETHAKQWAWALTHLPIRQNWVLALDADQSLTPELAEEIRTLQPPPEIHGYFINRRQVFRGRWIRHGGYYPKYLLKLFRRDQVRFDRLDFVDHHFYVNGSTKALRADLVERNEKEDDITFWIDKHNRYATLLALEEISRETSGEQAPIKPALFGNPDQRSLFLKSKWRRLPLLVRPFLYFFYRYFIRSGWLDGKEGFIFHFLQAYWFRLVVDAKIDEFRRRSPGAPAPSPAIQHRDSAAANQR